MELCTVSLVSFNKQMFFQLQYQALENVLKRKIL